MPCNESIPGSDIGGCFEDIHLALSAPSEFRVQYQAAVANVILFSVQIYIKLASLYNSNLFGGRVSLLNCWEAGEGDAHLGKYTY